ncbi:MAG TPA: polysaccharide deacetylase family protein [Longimicrobiaceae bacterium]|nr:polysaccharide deacetylase family protein [Longimicrobiaceae bacterium]
MSAAPAVLARVRAAAAALRVRWSAGPVILMYHRVAEPDSDPWQLAVSPRHFGEHLEVIRRRLRPLPLRGLVGALAEGGAPRRGAVVTFDDGYADNLHAARPLLERHDVPATVFVVAGMVGSREGFWWDRLAGLLLHRGRLPASVELELEGERLSLPLEGGSPAVEEAPERWVASDPPRTPREAAFLLLGRRLRRIGSAEREAILEELAGSQGISPIADPAARALSADELPRLAAGGLVEVGAHTVTHTELAALSPAAQEREIRGSRAELEACIDEPVVSFSYPFGGRSQYTPETARLVREAGFASACTTSAAPLRRSADPFRLPRVHVPDCDGDAFARLLSRWTPLADAAR